MNANAPRDPWTHRHVWLYPDRIKTSDSWCRVCRLGRRLDPATGRASFRCQGTLTQKSHQCAELQSTYQSHIGTWLHYCPACTSS